jgi:hypothetical protein
MVVRTCVGKELLTAKGAENAPRRSQRKADPAELSFELCGQKAVPTQPAIMEAILLLWE